MSMTNYYNKIYLILIPRKMAFEITLGNVLPRIPAIFSKNLS